jgi:hypothetical protein
MKRLSPALQNYFNATVYFPVSERVMAEKVADIFNIRTWRDLWKVKIPIQYEKEPEGGVLPRQVLQDLGTSLYFQRGDCEDIARGQIAVARTNNIPAYFLMVFTDTTYKNGHVMVLGLTDKGNLFVLNYTKYYIETTYTLTAKDIENDTTAFRNALSRIAYYLEQDQANWMIYWIVKLEYDSSGYLKAIGYIEPTVIPVGGDVETLYFEDNPENFQDELNALGYELKNVPQDKSMWWMIIPALGIPVILLLLRR